MPFTPYEKRGSCTGGPWMSVHFSQNVGKNNFTTLQMLVSLFLLALCPSHLITQYELQFKGGQSWTTGHLWPPELCMVDHSLGFFM